MRGRENGSIRRGAGEEGRRDLLSWNGSDKEKVLCAETRVHRVPVSLLCTIEE